MVKYGYNIPAIINTNPNIYPIVSEKTLQPGRYAIEKDRYTGNFIIYERVDINYSNNTYPYYIKSVVNYNGIVYLENTDKTIKEKTKYNVKRLYNREECVRRKINITLN